MKRKFLSGLALLLAAVLLLGVTGAAAEVPTPKSEVVYARLEPDGSLDGVYVVSSFELDQPGEVLDYGTYAQVSNLTTLDPLNYDGQAVTCQVSRAGRFYYQGNLETAALPWTIGIAWTLDGASISPQDLAGASGDLELAIAVGENPACTGPWFSQYALSISVTLDGDLCAHVSAEGGVVAASGGDCLVTFTLLPGSETVCLVRAEVHDFDMGSIQFAGVPLGLELELDSLDLSQITGSLSDLSDATAQLAQGARQLSDGAGELQEGMDAYAEGLAQLQEGLDRLNDNGDDLADGAAQLSDGVRELSEGLAQLGELAQGVARLAQGSAQVAQGISSLSQGINQLDAGFDQYAAGMAANGTSAAQLAAANQQAAEQLAAGLEQYGTMIALFAADPQYAELPQALNNVLALLQADAQVLSAQDELISGASAGTEQLAAGAAQLATSYTALDEGIQSLAEQLSGTQGGIDELLAGLEALADGAEDLADGARGYTDGVSAVCEGAAALAEGYDQIMEGYARLSEGAEALASGAEALAEGTDSLGEPQAMTRMADELLDGVLGGDGEAVSFVSPRNTRVEMVQFVFMTQGIHAPAAERTETVSEDTGNVISRLVDLFR